jgi:ABC-type multidrug transport system ATPase subunit
MSELIQVKNLTKKFGIITAVDDLSFSVNAGDVYGFLGQNGAGKSTTIRMLLSLIKPSAGNIEIFGSSIKKNKNEILSRIGAMIEKPDVYKYLSAYDNLKLFAKMSKRLVSDKIILEQLKLVGLEKRANDKVKTFSQGMKQRLGIAIAMVHDPEILLLDEPTNGLDPQGIADIRNLILYLSKEKKKTILISSHLLHEVEQIASRILIIDKGKKLVEGNSFELIKDAETIVELETTNNEESLKIINETSWAQHFKCSQNEFLVFKMHKNSVPTFNHMLVNKQIEVLQLITKHSLEDYFLQITNQEKNVYAATN